MPPAPQPPKNKRDFNWGRASKSIAFWALLLLIPVALIQISTSRNGESPAIAYHPQYQAELTRGNIKKVTIREGKYIQGEFKIGRASCGRHYSWASRSRPRRWARPSSSRRARRGRARRWHQAPLAAHPWRPR